MQNPGSGIPETRYGMSFGMNSGDTGQDLYGHSDYVLHAHHTHNPAAGHNQMLSPTHGSKRTADVAGLVIKQDPMTSLDPLSGMGLSHTTTPSIGEEGLDRNGPQTKKTPPPNGKKTKGRVKIKMEFIDNKLRRYTTFSKRKTGIMKKAYELSTLTGTQVMLLVASETGHVYTFATRKLQPMITSDAGKALIQTCLNSPDPPATSTDQRMSATGFEETELTYTVHDEDQKEMSGDEILEENAAIQSQSDNSRSSSPVEKTEEQHDAKQAGKHTGPKRGSAESSQGSNSGSTNLSPGFANLSQFGLNVPFGCNNASIPTSDAKTTTANVSVNFAAKSGNRLASAQGNDAGTSLSSQTQQLLQRGLFYQTPDGIVFAPPPGAPLPEGVLLNLRHNKLAKDSSANASQSYVAVPVSREPVPKTKSKGGNSSQASFQAKKLKVEQ